MEEGTRLHVVTHRVGAPTWDTARPSVPNPWGGGMGQCSTVLERPPPAAYPALGGGSCCQQQKSQIGGVGDVYGHHMRALLG